MTKQDKVYGGSLYELAKEEGLAEKIAEEIAAVMKIFDETLSELEELLAD